MNGEQKTKGEYLKFYVRRHDGRDKKGGDRDNADYFVLDLTYDKYAYIGLTAYAYAVEAEYPLLAADLFKKIYHPNYPFIYKACFAVTIDNGGLNQYRGESQIKEEYASFIESIKSLYPEYNLEDINLWFKSLKDEDMETATAGEDTDMQELFESAPKGAYIILERWFEEYC